MKPGKELGIKIFRTEKSELNLLHGEIQTDGKREFFIGCEKGALKVLELQLAGKKRMSVQSFLQGVSLEGAKLLI